MCHDFEALCGFFTMAGHYVAGFFHICIIGLPKSAIKCKFPKLHYFQELHYFRFAQREVNITFQNYMTKCKLLYNITSLGTWLFCTKANFTAVLYLTTYFSLLLCTNPRPSLHVLERIHDNDAHIHITQYPCVFPHQTSALATHQTSDESDKLLQIIVNCIRLQITNNRLNPKFIIQ